MKQDEIIEMARQHFCRVEYDDGDVHECYEFSLEELEAFAKLVAAKEREACAKMLEDWNKHAWNPFDCAEAIRARGEQA